jgi:hypothetical protein
LLVHPFVVVDIAKGIRHYLIETSKLTKINGRSKTIKEKLYAFLTSSEYNRDRHNRIELKLKLDELQRKEREYHTTMWNRRIDYIGLWDELDSKLDAFINDILQDKDEDNEEGGSSPLS